jgi:hypothetical protein
MDLPEMFHVEHFRRHAPNCSTWNNCERIRNCWRQDKGFSAIDGQGRVSTGFACAPIGTNPGCELV